MQPGVAETPRMQLVELDCGDIADDAARFRTLIEESLVSIGAGSGIKANGPAIAWRLGKRKLGSGNCSM